MSEIISAAMAANRFLSFLVVRQPVERAQVVILFPERHTDAVTDHAARVFERADAQFLLVIRGLEQLKHEEVQDRLVERGIPEECIVASAFPMHTRVEVGMGFSILEVDHRLIPQQALIVCAPHKGQRFRAILERVASQVSVSVCPPEDSIHAFLPREETSESDDQRVAAMLAGELQQLIFRNIQQQIRVEIPTELAHLAEQFCSQERQFGEMSRRTIA